MVRAGTCCLGCRNLRELGTDHQIADICLVRLLSYLTHSIYTLFILTTAHDGSRYDTARDYHVASI